MAKSIGNIRKWFLHNLGLKAFSLILAVLLWFYITGEQVEELKKVVPLRIDIPQGMTIVSTQTDSLDVVFRGPGNLISLLSSSEIMAHHVISDVEEPGEYTFTISPEEISIPRGIKVSVIEPPQVRVRLDRLITRRLPIRVDIEGEPATGFQVQVDKVSVTPNVSLVTGPESILKKLAYIRTVPIDVVGRTRTFVKKAALEPITGQKPMKEDDLIEVTIPIVESFVEKCIEGVDVKVLKDASSLWVSKVSPSKVDLTLSGPGVSLEELTAADIPVFLDVGSLEAGKHELPLKVILPEDITLISDIPAVEVVLEPTPELHSSPEAP